MISEQQARQIATECVQEWIDKGIISEAFAVEFVPAHEVSINCPDELSRILTKDGKPTNRVNLPSCWCVYFKNLHYNPNELDTEEDWLVILNPETGEIKNKNRIGSIW